MLTRHARFGGRIELQRTSTLLGVKKTMGHIRSIETARHACKRTTTIVTVAAQ